MIVNILLIVDFAFLAIVVTVYIISSMRERSFLKSRADQSLELQQKVYQAQVFQEINERIGYSLDTNKIVEIITSSLGNLLAYDTVSYMMMEEGGKAVFKCHVENSVSHAFVEEVKEKIFLAYSVIEDQEVKPKKIDESITGNILDDNSGFRIGSYFNLPVVISGKLIGIINVASREANQYGEDQTTILYNITNQAATAVSKLQALLESEKGKLSGILYALTDGVFTVDLQHRLILSNPAVKTILEIVSEKVLTSFDIVDALAGKVDLRTKIDQALTEDKPVFVPDVVLRDKALEVTVTPVKNDAGEKIGAAVVLHDITTEKALEKLRQEFTAMMVHELRAPLTAVRWSSESLLRNLSAAQAATEPDKIKDTVITIEHASNNMLELVNDLLDVAKIEAGKFELNVQEYDLIAVIKEQIKTFQSQAEMKHLEIGLTSPDSYRMHFDKVRIGQVMGNLISNSIKYTDAGRIEVNVSADMEHKQMIVAIKDTGVGISRDDLPQLFSKFKQLKSYDSSRKGTGLGLVVSKGIVEAHGGKIWAESAGENLGSTFYFSIPLKD
ncbi:MAG: ATP-binding protein [Patescibacteria group bacterium]|nr:ATP-binding protein [Patescibacteria group bacterium]